MLYLQGKVHPCASWKNVTVDGSCPEVSKLLPLEDYNKYAFVMDVDGGGWSGRYAYFLLSNTPVIKQVSLINYCERYFFLQFFLP